MIAHPDAAPFPRLQEGRKKCYTDRMPHMHDRYERFFDPQLLLWVNVAIIIVAETLGGGRMFFDTGLIHVPVILFILLVSTRIFGRYSLYDPVLRRFLAWSLGALAVLLVSDSVEFAAQNLGYRLPAPAVYGGVISFHLVAILAVAVGTFHILKAHGRMRYAAFWLAAAATVGVVSFLLAFAAYAGAIPAVPPVMYMAVAFAAGTATAVPTLALGRIVPALKDFSSYLGTALVFLTAAAGVNALHLIANGEYAVYRQAAYVSHFALFAALSLMFLAFGKMANLAGLSDRAAAKAAGEARGNGTRARRPAPAVRRTQ